jgi:hypothetical protein
MGIGRSDIRDGLDSAASAQLAIITIKTAKGDGLVKTKNGKKTKRH